MSRGLKRAQAMQGGGDREGPIMVLESEVGLICLSFFLYRALFQEQNYEANGSSVEVVPPGIMRGRGRVEVKH